MIHKADCLHKHNFTVSGDPLQFQENLPQEDKSCK